MKPQAANSELKATAVDATPAKDRVVIDNRENTQIREVYSCLTSCSQCSGVYVDSIGGTILRIVCRHECHSTHHFSNTEKNTQPQLNKQQQGELTSNQDYIMSRSSKEPAMLTPVKGSRPDQSVATVATSADAERRS
jgi:hypothetical protein